MCFFFLSVLFPCEEGPFPPTWQDKSLLKPPPPDVLAAFWAVQAKGPVDLCAKSLPCHTNGQRIVDSMGFPPAPLSLTLYQRSVPRSDRALSGFFLHPPQCSDLAHFCPCGEICDSPSFLCDCFTYSQNSSPTDIAFYLLQHPFFCF